MLTLYWMQVLYPVVFQTQLMLDRQRYPMLVKHSLPDRQLMLEYSSDLEQHQVPQVLTVAHLTQFTRMKFVWEDRAPGAIIILAILYVVRSLRVMVQSVQTRDLLYSLMKKLVWMH